MKFFSHKYLYNIEKYMIVFNYEVEYRFYKVLEQFFYYLSLYVEGLVIFCVNILFYFVILLTQPLLIFI